MEPAKLASVVIVFVLISGADSGSSCPPHESIRPCFCSVTEDSYTIMICSGIDATQLMDSTNSMKSMILDRFMLLGVFRKTDVRASLLTNEVESDLKESLNETGRERLPKSWLSAVRVKEVEIQDSALSNCFLCDNPFDGQSDFMTSLVATHSSLDGHLCSVCNTKIRHVSTKELQKIPNLKNLDLSHNNLEVVAGLALPSTLVNLKKIVLSNNKITRVHDRAFDNLQQLNELDLSNNQLTTISRKIFKDLDNSLKSLDLSWNSIQYLPENMFHNLRNLREFRISNNLLEILAENTFQRAPTLLEKLDVKGNFLVCNCSLSWISKKLNKNTKLVGKCVSPKEVEFQDVKGSLSTLQRC